MGPRDAHTAVAGPRSLIYAFCFPPPHPRPRIYIYFIYLFILRIYFYRYNVSYNKSQQKPRHIRLYSFFVFLGLVRDWGLKKRTFGC